MSAESEEITLFEVVDTVKEWTSYLWSKLLYLVILGVIGVLLGFFYSRYKKPVYTATTTFVLEESGGGSAGAMGQYAGLASMVGLDIGGGGNGLFSSDNIIALYKSRTMLKKVLLSKADFHGKNMLLIDRYIASNNLREKWAAKPQLKNVSFADSATFNIIQDSLMNEAIKDINENYLSITKPDKKATILQVDVKSNDELFSKRFTDQVVATVNDFYVQTKTKKSLTNVAILQRQTDSVLAVMNGAIYASANTLDATPNLNPTRQILRAPVQRSQFNAEMNKTVLGELVKNLELSKISLRKETPLIQVIDIPELPLEKDRISAVKSMIFGGLILGFFGVFYFIIRKTLA
jgi:uncharacterized protein involved in exopolysaccharide biosynthesis